MGPAPVLLEDVDVVRGVQVVVVRAGDLQSLLDGLVVLDYLL